MANDEFDLLRNGPVPTPRDAARERALDAALSAYDLQNTSAAPQGSESGDRLTERAWRLWSEMMNKKMYATPAIAGLLALPIAGYTTYYLMQDSPFAFEPDKKIGETTDKQGDVSTARAHRPAGHEAGQSRAAEGKKADDEGELGRDVTTDLLARAGSAEDRGAPIGSRAGSRRRAQRGAGRADEHGRAGHGCARRRVGRPRCRQASPATAAPRALPNRS